LQHKPRRSCHSFTDAVLRLGILILVSTPTRTHVLRMTGRSVAVIRQIRSVRPSVTWPVLESLVVSLVLTQLDYGCLLGRPPRLRRQSAHGGDFVLRRPWTCWPSHPTSTIGATVPLLLSHQLFGTACRGGAVVHIVPAVLTSSQG